jgi:hypothetical protein
MTCNGWRGLFEAACHHREKQEQGKQRGGNVHAAPIATALALRFADPCAGKPTIALRVTDWHKPQEAQVTLSDSTAGHIATVLPAGVFVAVI